MFTRPVVCLVTDRRRLAPDARTTPGEIAALHAWLDDAIAAGVDVIQLRERDLEAAVLRDMVSSILQRVRGTSTRVIVNDRADVALAAGAHGVHLRGDGPPAPQVRRLVDHDWIVGRSIHAPGEIERASPPDYYLFGTVFETASKPGVEAAGITALRSAAVQSRVPVFAIGGITPPRAAECIRAGAAGVAAIGIFLPPGRSSDALGPAEAVRRLRAACEAAVLE